MNTAHLKNALMKAWSAETSYEPHKWTPDNPSFGQCAITACIVQDHFGGDIVGADYTQPDGVKDLHFFNVIGGQWIDLTREQFPAGTIIHAPRPLTENHSTTREFILSYDSTKNRYAKLKLALNQE